MKSARTFSDTLHHYMLDHSLRETELLFRLRQETAQHPFAIMQIPPEQGQFMAFLLRMLGAKKVIEVGTFTGYSALCMAMALPDDGHLVTCDIHAEFAAIGQPYWHEAGLEGKIELCLGPAADTLENLIQTGAVGTVDFVFIDADKQGYDGYYEQALTLLRPGGVIALDNVFLFGSVVASEADEPLPHRIDPADVEAMQRLNRKITYDQRVEITMLPMADGLTLVQKKGAG
ncbi:class I SAM-dependent methyltransferase [Magnetococcus sp. PR-3]|uniref:class I SAM-dependent methyltransferase n=1 Tax=Magnetococcus sp. PR-3 TaxID=3120355 RepID=UPI002FCDF63F